MIDNLRSTPGRLADEGQALTWSIMRPHFIDAGKNFHGNMRDALQHVYFREYCNEFKLVVLSDIPYITDVFYLPTDRKVYSLKRLRVFLATMGMADVFLKASAEFIMQMRRLSGFIELMDAYAGFATAMPNNTEMEYHAARAINEATFDWAGLAVRRAGAISDPTSFEAVEIGHGCGELAGILSREHGLATRLMKGQSARRAPVEKIVRGRQMKVALFVALEEELEVLVDRLGLKRHTGLPAASGQLGAIECDVLCPRDMGRVAAAIEVSRYLSQAQIKPDLVLCVGLAGGFPESKIDHGTVICATTVVDLANRKVVDDADGNAQSKFRRQDFTCSRAVYSVAQSDEFNTEDWENYSRKEFDWPKGRTPSLREGKITSVDEVISSDDHRGKLIAHGDKLLGVEMEAGGVCAAAHKFHIPFDVIRVVSDLADPAKADDEWRKKGMKTLAELLKRLPFEKVIATAKT